MPLKLFQYTSYLFVRTLFIVTVIFASAFFIIDLVELTIRTHAVQIPIITIMKTSLAHIPFIIQETSLLLLFASLIYTFVSLARHNEYTAIKASGVSLKKFLLPFVIVSFLFSTMIIAILNPISAHLLQYRNHLKHITDTNTTEPIALSRHGVLLLDMPKSNKEELYIISAAHLNQISPKEINLYKVSYIITSQDYVFQKRIDAEKAVLQKNEWTLTNAIEKQVKKNSIKHQEIILPSSLKPQDLINSFLKPKQISVWALPDFIQTLKIIGGSTDQYVKYLYKLLIQPFLAIGIVCITAAFSLKSHRNSNNQRIIANGVFVGFISFIYIELVMKLQIADVASIINPIITILSFTIIGIIALYYSENKQAF